MSKENMPREVMVNILTHLTEPVMPHYQNLDGKALAYFLRLLEFRTPTCEIEGELYGEQKCDVLKVLTTNEYDDLDLQVYGIRRICLGICSDHYVQVNGKVHRLRGR